MQFSCTDPRGNERCDLRNMASNLCFENGWRRTTKLQVLSITNDRWNPLLKKKYTMPVAWDYRLYRGGGGGGGESRDFQWRGTNHRKQDKEYAKQLFFKL